MRGGCRPAQHHPLRSRPRRGRNQITSTKKLMKLIANALLLTALFWTSCTRREMNETAEATRAGEEKSKLLFLDVHNLEPGKVTFDAVAGAHEKDLATQGKYGVSFIKYWVDEAQ